MKNKLPGALLLTLMMGLLLFLLVFMCVPYDAADGAVQNGVLDLRGQELEGCVYTLDGDWEFFYGQALNSEAFADAAVQADLIRVPGAWGARGYPQSGTGTYRLRVRSDPAYPLQLHIPHISGAYTVWVDGELQSQNGVLSDDPGENSYAFRIALTPVGVRDGESEILIQVSNQRFYNSGITKSMFIGERNSLWRWFQRTRGLYLLATGGILMIAFYHLALYVFRRREKAYLLFFILCLTCAVRFAYEDGGLLELLGIGGTVQAILRVYYVLLLLHVTAVSMFCTYVFHPGLYARSRKWIDLYLAAGCALYLVMPIHTTYVFFHGFGAASGVIMGIFAIVAGLRYPTARRDPWMVLFLADLILYVTAGLGIKLLLTDTWYMSGLFLNMFLIQSLVLSRSYTRAFALVEETGENLERIVAQRTDEIRATGEAMKELAANISHDIKTPLSVMRVNLEEITAAAEYEDDTAYARQARGAYNMSLHLQCLIQNRFELNRGEPRRFLCVPQWVPLSRLLASVQSRYDAYLDSLDILLDITGSGDGQVSIDPKKMWSIFDNIINAARHTEPGGEITVTTRAQGGAVTVTVRDTGCGIAPEHLPHVFERHHQVRQDDDKETGVGLYIVRGIMESLGGKAEAESEQGAGTAIHLNFPYTTSPPQALKQSPDGAWQMAQS